jgi:hypothetical protein
MDDKHRQGVEEDAAAEADTPGNPEERAFTGHPDHPPSSPDQTLEGNEELLQRPEDDEDEPQPG